MNIIKELLAFLCILCMMVALVFVAIDLPARLATWLLVGCILTGLGSLYLDRRQR